MPITESSLVNFALEYANMGMKVIPIPLKQKAPLMKEWQKLRLTEEEIRQLFSKPSNIGILLGEPSGWLVDIDLDDPLAVKLAPYFLPFTEAVFGRDSKPCSHWLYICFGAKTTKWQGIDGEMIVELRSTGCQTVFPPSIHPSGETITWYKEGRPIQISRDELEKACSRLASAVLLAKYWPSQGTRQDTALALAGGLIRLGFNEEEAERFIEAVTVGAGDEESKSRVRTVLYTARKAGSSPTTGWKRLSELVGEEVVSKVLAWLGWKKQEEVFEDPPKKEKERESQAQSLVNLALSSGVELFHTPDGNAYATVPVNGHKETWPVSSRGSGPFRNWLRRIFFEKHGKPPGSQALQDAIGVLEAKAQFDGPEYPVFTRIAEHDGKIYIDLANDTWEAVEISPVGWRVISDCPVKFRRSKGMLPLPHPESGGSLEELKRFLNIPDEDSWRLMVAWLLASLRPKGPYPVLLLQGEQGSAKSTTSKALRALIDPNTAPLRTCPKDERDLMITATNSWAVSFDNLSGIPVWLSDALCRLATGGGFSTRTLYENDEETIFSACRPIIANGIDEIASRHDLLDRAIIIHLPPIPEENRKDEAQFWAEFEKARPKIFGALLDAVSAGLRNIDSVHLDKLPRMADFAKWITACEEALPWPSGGFMEAYMGNREEAIEVALEGDIVAVAVKNLLEEREIWEGTASELLEALEVFIDDTTKRSVAWPKNPRNLGNRLRRVATFLRQAGIEVEFLREGHDRRRLIRLKRENVVRNVRNVRNDLQSFENTGLEVRTICGQRADNADEVRTKNENSLSATETLKDKGLMDAYNKADNADDKIPIQSNDMQNHLWDILLKLAKENHPGAYEPLKTLRIAGVTLRKSGKGWGFKAKIGDLFNTKQDFDDWIRQYVTPHKQAIKDLFDKLEEEINNVNSTPEVWEL
ncbi:hypothetical protein AN618_15060 [Fervidicola ferrireducens]|uniref:DNA primase/polymerase bifunctional N-terminal domain-containing protein n=1 Tax=Fervidicola ferrireducens TaxID=520764 RepID=A0A140L7T8_9FIRM|nr:bifunctional DNA primase/polymerase [Fervidicola ferrireducens]KXG76613.1 hypothetical protein AN618_15060 [Fervidicola ferrireducens]